MATRPDNFLAEAVKSKPVRLSYFDGFRFGIGFFVANLLMLLILGALAWGVVLAFHLH
jgi:hypothetical protein